MRSIYPNMIAQQSAFNIYFNNIFSDFYHPPWTSNSWILGLDRHHIRILPSSIFPWGLHGCTWFGSQQEIFPSLGLTAGGDSAHIRAGPGSCAFSDGLLPAGHWGEFLRLPAASQVPSDQHTPLPSARGRDGVMAPTPRVTARGLHHLRACALPSTDEEDGVGTPGT